MHAPRASAGEVREPADRRGVDAVALPVPVRESGPAGRPVHAPENATRPRAMTRRASGTMDGAPRRNRTFNLLIKSQLLCQLS